METLDTLFPHAVPHSSHLRAHEATPIALSCGVGNEGLQTCSRGLASRSAELHCWGCCAVLLIVGMMMCLKASETPRPCCHRPSASWLHGLTGAWHCTSGTSALELPGWHRAGAEQAYGLSLLVHKWARSCPSAVRGSTGVSVRTLAGVGGRCCFHRPSTVGMHQFWEGD